jgi:hypothetical protein
VFRVIGAAIANGSLGGQGNGRDRLRAHETRKVTPRVRHRFGVLHVSGHGHGNAVTVVGGW